MREPFELTKLLNCMAVDFLAFLCIALCERSLHMLWWKCWSKSTLIVLLLKRQDFFSNAMRYLPAASWENSVLFHKTHARKNGKKINWKKKFKPPEGPLTPGLSALCPLSAPVEKNTTSFFLLTYSAKRASSASGTVQKFAQSAWGLGQPWCNKHKELALVPAVVHGFYSFQLRAYFREESMTEIVYACWKFTSGLRHGSKKKQKSWRACWTEEEVHCGSACIVWQRTKKQNGHVLLRPRVEWGNEIGFNLIRGIWPSY